MEPENPMTREDVVALAESKGWKAWGKLRKSKGSSYQPFRRRNEYVWIGYAFVERSTRAVAVDFRFDAPKVDAFLT